MSIIVNSLEVRILHIDNVNPLTYIVTYKCVIKFVNSEKSKKIIIYKGSTDNFFGNLAG